jgi:hypothetical protein
MIRYAVELAIETEHEGEERERLLAELDLRMEAESTDDHLHGPGQYEDLIKRICRDLGLSAARLRRDFYWEHPAYAPPDATDFGAGP